MLHQALIDPMFLSDHHPISLTLAFPDVLTRPTSWRLDPALLTDSAVVADLTLRLKQYFTENNSPETSAAIKWEEHKCVIWGVLTAAAAKRK